MFSWPEYINSLAPTSPLRLGFSVIGHFIVFWGSLFLSNILLFIFPLEFWGISYSWRKAWWYILITTIFIYILRTFIPFMILIHNFLVNLSLFIALKIFEPQLNSIKIILGLVIANFLTFIGSLILFSSNIISKCTVITLPLLLLGTYIEVCLLFIVTIILILMNRKKQSLKNYTNLFFKA